MPNRVLFERICESETIESLTVEAERFFYRLLVKADDFGRFHARPSLLRAACFPLALDRITDEMVQTWLIQLTDAQLVEVYVVEGREYLTVRSWTRYQRQRAEKSKYPAPADCEHPRADVSESQQDAARATYLPGTRNSRNEKRETRNENDARGPQAAAVAPNGAAAPGRGRTKSADPPNGVMPPPPAHPPPKLAPGEEWIEPGHPEYSAIVGRYKRVRV